MMKTIKYTIEFFSNWHCGSGLAAGADVDELVVKDADGLPFIPGRTIKGLLRDAMREQIGYDGLTEQTVNALFGYTDNKDKHGKGCVYFGNATLATAERQTILKEKLASYLYRSFTSTAIDDEGIAKQGSLRCIETVVPCVLHGELHDVPEDSEKYVENAFGFIKRLGLGRTRGYGRCMISKEQ